MVRSPILQTMIFVLAGLLACPGEFALATSVSVSKDVSALGPRTGWSRYEHPCHPQLHPDLQSFEGNDEADRSDTERPTPLPLDATILCPPRSLRYDCARRLTQSVTSTPLELEQLQRWRC
jgi:hypothetical protein